MGRGGLGISRLGRLALVALVALALAGCALPLAAQEDEDPVAPVEAAGPQAGPVEALPTAVVQGAEGAQIAVSLPSGREVFWAETLSDIAGPAGLTLRFRFVAPALVPAASDEDYAAVAADMQLLCDGFALPRLPEMGPRPAQVVISLADRLVPFGEADEAAVQYFEAYSLANGRCDWELY